MLLKKKKVALLPHFCGLILTYLPAALSFLNCGFKVFIFEHLQNVYSIAVGAYFTVRILDHELNALCHPFYFLQMLIHLIVGMM